jgi:thiamine-phosphate pyrophosphorylase
VTRRQTMPRQWLIADQRLGDRLWPAIRKLPAGSGVLVLFHGLPTRQRRALLTRLRRLAREKGLRIVDEGSRLAARVHTIGELRRALLARTELVFLSPVYPTRSHPEWPALPRMRLAAFAQLGRRRLYALGGMTARRFARVRPLGFQGWAGIDAFRT